jgi:hypothetical protein
MNTYSRVVFTTVLVAALSPAVAIAAPQTEASQREAATDKAPKQQTSNPTERRTSYQFDRKKLMNMDCRLRFNPSSGSGCNY